MLPSLITPGALVVGLALATGAPLALATDAADIRDTMMRKAENLNAQDQMLINRMVSTLAVSPANKEMAATLGDIRAKGAEVAKTALSAGRKDANLAKFLGFPENHDKRLYYFVSLSLPPGVLQGYARDAAFTGGALVFRGLRRGETMNQFMVRTREAIGTQIHGRVQMHPPLFDQYQVEHVPAIVYVDAPDGEPCYNQTSHPVKKGNRTLSYKRCGAANPKVFWKVSGAVTTDYALRSFIETGAIGAKAIQDKLAAAGRATGGPAKLDISAKPSNKLSATERKIVIETLKKTAPQVYERPDGSLVAGPAGLEKHGDPAKWLKPVTR